MVGKQYIKADIGIQKHQLETKTGRTVITYNCLKWDSFATVLRKEKSSAFQRKASVWTGLLKRGCR